MSMYIVAELDKTSNDVCLHVQGYDTTGEILAAFAEYIQMCDQDDPELAQILRSEAGQLELALDNWNEECQLEVHTGDKAYFIRKI